MVAVTRLLVVAALTSVSVLAPVGTSQAAQPSCPKDSLCLFPQAEYQGKPKVVRLPKDQRKRLTMSDDAGCLKFAVGSLIDNTPFGGTVYGNTKCDDSGDNADFTAADKLPKIASWAVHSLVFPTD